MAIAAVSGSRWQDNNFGAITDTVVSGALAGTVAVGELLVAVHQLFADENQTFSDDKGNTWHTASVRSYNGAVGAAIQFGWAFVTTGGTVTVSATSATSSNRQLAVSRYTGADTGVGPDGTATAANNGTGSNSTVAPGSITGTGAGILIAAGLSPTAGDLAAASGYTAFDLDPPAFTYDCFAVQEKVTGAGGAEDPAFNASTQKDYWLAIGIAFRASGGGGSSIAAISSNDHLMGVR